MYVVSLDFNAAVKTYQLSFTPSSAMVKWTHSTSMEYAKQFACAKEAYNVYRLLVKYLKHIYIVQIFNLSDVKGPMLKSKGKGMYFKEGTTLTHHLVQALTAQQ